LPFFVKNFINISFKRILSTCRWSDLQLKVDTRSFDLTGEDAQDKNGWRLRIKGALANPGLPGNKAGLKHEPIRPWLRVPHFWGPCAQLIKINSRETE